MHGYIMYGRYNCISVVKRENVCRIARTEVTANHSAVSPLLFTEYSSATLQNEPRCYIHA